MGSLPTSGSFAVQASTGIQPVARCLSVSVSQVAKAALHIDSSGVEFRLKKVPNPVANGPGISPLRK